MSKSNFRLIAVAILFLVFASYNFIRAYDESVWFPPAGSPATHNVATPINTGTTNQVKNASLGVDGLSVTSDYPTIAFVDPRAGHRILYMQNHSNTFNLLGDRNGDGQVIWTDDQPQALSVYLGATPDQDYTYVNNQVRANKYCNGSGTKCASMDDLINLLPNTCDVLFQWSWDYGASYTQRTVQLTGGKNFAIGVYSQRSGGSLTSTPLLTDQLASNRWDCGWYDWTSNSCHNAIVGYVDPINYAANSGAYNTSSGGMTVAPLALSNGSSLSVNNPGTGGFGGGTVILKATVSNCNF